MSDQLSNYHLERREPGNYTVEITAKGYTTQTKVHHITRGKIDDLDWEM